MAAACGSAYGSDSGPTIGAETPATHESGLQAVLPEQRMPAAAAVLSDPNLVWAILQSLVKESGAALWSLPLLCALASVNRTFRSAAADQPVLLDFRKSRLGPAQARRMQETQLCIAALLLHPADERATGVLTSKTFRDRHAGRLVLVQNLVLNHSLCRRFSLAAPLLRALATLVLSSGEAACALTITFCSQWVYPLCALEALSLQGYLLRELLHLPPSLAELDLSTCRVARDVGLRLPDHLRLRRLAIPSGGHFRFTPTPGMRYHA